VREGVGVREGEVGEGVRGVQQLPITHKTCHTLARGVGHTHTSSVWTRLNRHHNLQILHKEKYMNWEPLKG